MFEQFGQFFQWLRGRFLPATGTTVAVDAKTERDMRLKAMQEGWRFYYGEMPKPLRVKIGQPDDNVTLNFGKIIVDKNVSFLFGDEIEFTVDGPEEDERQQKLKACWDWNRKQTLLHLMGLNGSVTGHTFVKVVMNENLPFPRLINLDPALVDPQCDPNDWESVHRYIISWQGMGGEKKAVMRRQVIEPIGTGWIILDQVSQDGGRSWQEENRTDWPFAFPPIFHCQNLPVPNQFWGLSDLSPDILRLLNNRNFIASNMARILRFHAHPKTFAKGMANGQKLEMGVDDIVYLPNPSADLGTLEMRGDLASSLSYLMYLDENLLSLANLPPIALGRMDVNGPISGVALRIRYQPLIQRINTKRRLYGDMLTDLNSALLNLMGHEGEHQCENVWADPLPANRPEQAETGVLLDQLGVSKQTIVTDMGYDWTQEEERKAEERKASLEDAQTAFDRGNVLPPGNNPLGGNEEGGQ